MTVKEINIAFATPVPILIENTFITFKYPSFSRGYHVYKDVHIPINGYDLLICEREENDENDKNVAIIRDDCVSKDSRSCCAKLEQNDFQISSIYKSSHSCRGDWKESQSWSWIGTRNTCKLFFYGDAKS